MYENPAMLSVGADARLGSAQLLLLVLCGALLFLDGFDKQAIFYVASGAAAGMWRQPSRTWDSIQLWAGRVDAACARIDDGQKLRSNSPPPQEAIWS
jgi:hypothetical protein